MNHVDEMSQFLTNVEESARSILRKNNAIERNEVRCEGKEVSLRSKPRRRHDKLEASPLFKSSISNQKSGRGGCGSLEEGNHLGTHGLKNTGWNRKSLVGKAPRSKPNGAMLDAATLRKRFRCDEYLIFPSKGNGCHTESRPASVRKDHPIQYLISQHVATIASKFDAMTQKRLLSMWAELRQSHLNELHQGRMPCWNKSVAEEDNKRVIKENRCNGNNEIKVDVEVSLNRRLEGLQDSTCKHSRVLVESKRLLPIAPPKRWTIVAREKINSYSEAGDCRISIHRTSGKDIHCWIVELLYSNNSKERYILYDDEITYLVTSLSPFDAADFQVCNVKHDAYTLVHHEIIDIGDTGNGDGGSSLTDIDARIYIRQRDSILVAILSVQVVGGDEDNSCPCPLAQILIPIYEIISVLELYHLFEALDTEFWTSKSVEALYIWKKLIRSIEITFDLKVSCLPTSGRRSVNSIFYDAHFIIYFYSLQGGRGLLLNPCWLGNEKKYIDLSRGARSETQNKEMLKVGNGLMYSMTTEVGLRNVISILRQEKFQDKERKNLEAQLNKMMDHARPLSLRLASSRLYNRSLIPGVCSFGKIGPTISFAGTSNESLGIDVDCIDSTQVALLFDRSGNSTSTVTTRLALESPISAPIFHVFDPTPRLPEFAVDDPVHGPVSLTMAQSSTLMKERLVSPVDTRRLPSIVSVDGRGMDPSEIEEIEDFHLSTKDCNLSFTKESFRKRCLGHRVDHDVSFPLHKFGVSENGLLPNTTRVSDSTIWHSEEACTHLLSKERGSNDFVHMIQHEASGKDGGSPNDPLISIICMKAYKVNTIKGIKKKDHVESKRLKTTNEEENKQRKIFEMKLAAADCIMHNKLAENGSNAQSIKRMDTPFLSSVSHEMPLIKNQLMSSSTRHPVNKGEEWRCIPSSIVGVNFFDLGLCKVGEYDKNEDLYQLNKPRMVRVIATSNATSYTLPDDHFQVSTRTEFVDNLLEDRFHISHQIKTSQRSKDIMMNSEQQFALQHILNVPLQNTEVDSKIPIEVRENYGVPKGGSSLEASENNNTHNEVLTIQATRHANFEKLEEMLDDLGVDIDTADEYGNTLLLLVAQQGNKKLCKFLLRRGAYINAQNHSGNSVMHYLHKYSHLHLADYMRRKGADDSYLNSDGLTCYEVTTIL